MDPPSALVFTDDEYARRLALAHQAMVEREVDVLVVTDPSNMCWLCGYEAWSFYVPQALLLVNGRPQPIWVGRAIDVEAVRQTTQLGEEDVRCYDDNLVQMGDGHPASLVAESILAEGFSRGRIALELESYYMPPRYRDQLEASMPAASFVDFGVTLNRLRAVKSAEEIMVLRQAAAIAHNAMTVALENMNRGVRESDVVAAVLSAQVRGVDGISGHLPSSPPYLLRGKRGACAHLSWGDGVFTEGESAYLELLGCRHRYQVTLSRAVHFGSPPRAVANAAAASIAAIEEALATAWPGATCADVANAMLDIIRAHGIEKTTRCGYATGIAYPPTSGERSYSLHPGDRSQLAAGMTFHIHPNLTFVDWGLYITDTLLITESGAQPLTNLPRHLVIR